MESQEGSSNTTPAEENVVYGDLEILRKNHDEAFLYVSQGLSYEESEENALACDMYEKGLERLNTAISIRCDRPHCTGPQWDTARTLQQKMLRSKREVQSRLQSLQGATSLYNMCDLRTVEKPPSYEEAVGIMPFSHSNVALSSSANGKAQAGDSKDSKPEDEDLYKNMRVASRAEELFCISEGVQIFYVSPEGYVSAPSSPTSLHIYKFRDEISTPEGAFSRPVAWLQVGSWTYPLVPTHSPSLQAGFGAYLFPDINSGQYGAAVGILLPADLPLEMRHTFENLMEELTSMRCQPLIVPEGLPLPGDDATESKFSHKVSKGIVTGSEVLSAGLTKGAEVTSGLLKLGATKLREHIKPEETDVFVDPRLQQGMSAIRKASGSVLKVSGFFVSRVGDLTVALGHHLARSINAKAADNSSGSSKLNDVMVIAAGGVKGFANVFIGLENAAKILASSLANETVDVVNHKYGPQAGEVVGNAVYSVGNLALTAHNIRSLGIKGIAKKTAKETGKAVLKEKHIC